MFDDFDNDIDDFKAFYDRICKEHKKRIQYVIKNTECADPIPNNESQNFDTLETKSENNSKKEITTLKKYILLIDDFAAYLKLKTHELFYDIFCKNAIVMNRIIR